MTSDAVIALAHRGVLTNASALDSYGVWRGTDYRIHVLLPPHSSIGHNRITGDLAKYAANRMPTTGVVRHWASVTTTVRGWRTSPVDALASFALTQSPEHLVAAVDSAMHTGALPPAMLAWLNDALPARLRPLLLQVDGRAEAGTETLARLRLGILSRKVEIQVTVGPHRLDILIDGWLNIEIDSEEWHGRERLKNSQRDTWLGGRGYVVLRFDYAEVMDQWAACLAAIQFTLAIGQRRTR